MSFISLILALLGAATGVVSAYYWYLSAQVQISPLWVDLGVIEPLGSSQSQAHWVVGIINAANKSARLNRIAALATAAATLLAAASGVATALTS